MTWQPRFGSPHPDAVLALRASRYSGSGDWLDESGLGHDAVTGATWDGTKWTFVDSQQARITQTDDFAVATDESLTVVMVTSGPISSSTGLIDTKNYSNNFSGWSAYYSGGNLNCQIGDNDDPYGEMGRAYPVGDGLHTLGFVLNQRSSLALILDDALVNEGTPSAVGDIIMQRDLIIGGLNGTSEIYGVVVVKAALTLSEIAEVAEWIMDPTLMALRASRYSGSGDWLDESGRGNNMSAVGTIPFDGKKFSITQGSNIWRMTDHLDLGMGEDDDYTALAVFSDMPSDLNANIGIFGFGRPFAFPGWWIYVTGGGAGITRGTDDDGGTWTLSSLPVTLDSPTPTLIGFSRDASEDTRQEYAGSFTAERATNTAGSYTADDGTYKLQTGFASNQPPWSLYGLFIARAALTADEVAEVAEWIADLREIGATLEVEIEVEGALFDPPTFIEGALDIEVDLEGEAFTPASWVEGSLDVEIAWDILLEEIKLLVADKGIHAPPDFSAWEVVRGSITHEDVTL